MKKGVPVVEHPLGKDVFVFFGLEPYSSISLALLTQLWWVHPDSNRGLTGYEPVALDR
jgi:hypothetical protein